jgi:hypothetical protein
MPFLLVEAVVDVQSMSAHVGACSMVRGVFAG